MKVFLIFIFIISTFIGGSIKINNLDNKENLINEISEMTETVEQDNLIAPVSYNEFTGSATQLTLNTTSTGHYTNPGSKLYFSFTSTETQYIKLNYVGQNASLIVYNYCYYSSNDYLVQLDNINDAEDIIYMDMNQIYIFVFSNHLSWGDMSITPSKLDTTFANHEKYILHLTYDEISTIGYHYEVEYFDVSLTEATSTTEYIISNGTVEYLDLISDNINFRFVNDSRRLVSNTNYAQYSSIAFSRVRVDYIDNSIIQNSSYRGTGTFIDETTVLSCAHLIYNQVKDSNGIKLKTSLNKSLKFYPGANSYNNPNWYSDYGEYTACDTYVPISYIIFGELQEYDWSLSLTVNSIQGYSTHSYMRISYFSANGSELYPSSTIIESAGYPGVTITDSTNNNFIYSMWASYPLLNSIYNDEININILKSKQIYVSGGNSGGPLFITYSTIVNGTLKRYSNIIGIVSTMNRSTIYEPEDYVKCYSFNYSRHCRVRPIIINTYKEIVNYEA